MKGVVKESLSNEITVGGLLAQLESFKEYRELTEYRVTERFNKTGEQIYNVHNLSGERFSTEFGSLIMFDDLEHKMIQGYKVLRIISTSSINRILHVLGTKKWSATVLFQDGTIRIEEL